LSSEEDKVLLRVDPLPVPQFVIWPRHFLPAYGLLSLIVPISSNAVNDVDIEKTSLTR